MALGTLGSTLNDELNRLANGGTYRDMDDMVDEALAAKQWANRENIIPYSTDTVGILNEIAGLGLDKRNWLDFNGVCNYIAGTTGLPAAAALRQVYPTTDLLTGVASYYVDATAPTNWGSLGYVYLNGVTGNVLGVANAVAPQINSDFDFRARVALDDWTPSASQYLIGKWGAAGNYAYGIYVSSAGRLGITWSANGTAFIDKQSTVSPTVADGATLWVRITLDVDNGSSGNTVRFYTSSDGSTWTDLGDPVVTAGTTSIYASTGDIIIGGYLLSQGNTLAGKLYRAQLLNGIGGTTVLDVNIATDYSSSRLDTFTATTGQTVTVNGVGVVNNLGAAGSLLPTTVGSSTAADSNDPKFLDHTGTNYVYTPANGNYLTTADAAALDITGDIDLRMQIALDDWTPAAINSLIAKWGTGVQRSFYFRVDTSGTLSLLWSPDGTFGSAITATSTVATGVADGSTKWVRVTLDVDNGASGRDIKFFLSDNGTSWTQLGSTVTQAGTTSIFSGTEPIFISTVDAANLPIVGKIFRAQIFNGIDGTKVLDVDTSVITAGSTTSFTAVTGQTVTINRSTSGRKTVAVTQPTWLFGTDDYMEVNNRYMASGTYLYVPGVNSNNASTPDAAALDITGDIDVRCKVAMDDWTPSTSSGIIAKWGGLETYRFRLETNGSLQFAWKPSVGSAILVVSTVPVGIADGATKWVRATLDVDNGASGYDVKFWLSDDGVAWTQLGTTVTGAGVTDIVSTAEPLAVGSFANGFFPSRGKFFRAQVLNGIDGTVVFDANFETGITSLLQTSFTESSTNAATVTINRSGSTYRSAGITAAGYLYPGATNTFSASATDFLNFGAADSYTAMIIYRPFATQASPRRLLAKWGDQGTGWLTYTASATTFGSAEYTPSTSVVTGNLPTIGTLATATTVSNRSTLVRTLYANGSVVGTGTTTAASISSFDSFLIGAGGSLGSRGNFADIEFIGAAIFRTVLTAAQIRQISNYFSNREAVL